MFPEKAGVFFATKLKMGVPVALSKTVSVESRVSEFEDLLCGPPRSSASFAFELPFNTENTEDAGDAEKLFQT